jgi:hypothetical protein
MEVRLHRLRWESLDSPALIEFLICLLVIGIMTWVAVRGMPRIQQRLYVLGAILLASPPKIAMMEYRAATGVWPDSDASASQSSVQTHRGKWIDAEAIRPGGAVDFRFSSRTNEIAGKTVTFRAWQTTGESDLPVVWLCGRAVTRPLIASSEDRTTLDDAELPSPCRASY